MDTLKLYLANDECLTFIPFREIFDTIEIIINYNLSEEFLYKIINKYRCKILTIRNNCRQYFIKIDLNKIMLRCSSAIKFIQCYIANASKYLDQKHNININFDSCVFDSEPYKNHHVCIWYDSNSDSWSTAIGGIMPENWIDLRCKPVSEVHPFEEKMDYSYVKNELLGLSHLDRKHKIMKLLNPKHLKEMLEFLATEFKQENRYVMREYFFYIHNYVTEDTFPIYIQAMKAYNHSVFDYMDSFLYEDHIYVDKFLKFLRVEHIDERITLLYAFGPKASWHQILTLNYLLKFDINLDPKVTNEILERFNEALIEANTRDEANNFIGQDNSKDYIIAHLHISYISLNKLMSIKMKERKELILSNSSLGIIKDGYVYIDIRKILALNPESQIHHPMLLNVYMGIQKCEAYGITEPSLLNGQSVINDYFEKLSSYDENYEDKDLNTLEIEKIFLDCLEKRKSSPLPKLDFRIIRDINCWIDYNRFNFRNLYGYFSD